MAVGLIAGFALTPAIASQLFGASSADPMTYLTVTTVLMAASILAAWSPAPRAMRTDPATTLRR